MNFDFALRSDLEYDNDITQLLLLSNRDDFQSVAQQIMPMPVGLPYFEPNSDLDGTDSLEEWAASFMDSIGMEGHVSCYSTSCRPHELTLVKLKSVESSGNSGVQTNSLNIDKTIQAPAPDHNTANGNANAEVEHNIPISGSPQRAERADLRSLPVRVFVALPL